MNHRYRKFIGRSYLLAVRFRPSALEGNIYLEVKLAPHSFYAFHIEAQSIKGDDPDPSFVD